MCISRFTSSFLTTLFHLVNYFFYIINCIFVSAFQENKKIEKKKEIITDQEKY